MSTIVPPTTDRQDDDGPTRCLILNGPASSLAEAFASATGLSVARASELVDVHIVRGDA